MVDALVAQAEEVMRVASVGHDPWANSWAWEHRSYIA